MARGDMGYKSTSVGVGVEILNRTKFEGVPMTLDFASVSVTDADTKEKMVKAGSPIDKDGRPVLSTPWANAVGILLDDVYESRPQGTVLKRAYINSDRAEANASVTYDATLVAVLINNGCNIIFEDSAVVGTIPADAS